MLSASLRAAVARERQAQRDFDLSLPELLRTGQPFVTLAQGSEGWHRARAGRLTASVFGVAAGVSPYATPSSLWHALTGRVNDGGEFWEGNEHTRRGSEIEAEAVRAYGRLTGGAPPLPCGLFLHPRHDFLAASPDGLLGCDGVLEVKCPARGAHTEVPAHYLAQVQGQLLCTGRAWAHFFSYCASAGTATLFRVPFSQDYAAWLLPRLQLFYAALIADIDPGGDLPCPPTEPPPRVDTQLLQSWG